MNRDELSHVGVLGMRWGHRKRAESAGRTISSHSPLRGKMTPLFGKTEKSVGTQISSHSPLRGKMTPLLGKKNRAKIKDAIDRELGRDIGLKRISELKNKEVKVTWDRGKYVTTIALATIGAWKVGEWLAKVGTVG